MKTETNNSVLIDCSSRHQSLKRTVFPSKEETIIAIDCHDNYGGAHLYHIMECAGFKDGNTVYCKGSNSDGNIEAGRYQAIQFVHKMEDGTLIPGLQSEQLVIMLLDRVEKLNKMFPCKENDLQIKALNDFLDACKLRVENRIKRGVMGELKK